MTCAALQKLNKPVTIYDFLTIMTLTGWFISQCETLWKTIGMCTFKYGFKQVSFPLGRTMWKHASILWQEPRLAKQKVLREACLNSDTLPSNVWDLRWVGRNLICRSTFCQNLSITHGSFLFKRASVANWKFISVIDLVSNSCKRGPMGKVSCIKGLETERRILSDQWQENINTHIEGNKSQNEKA